MCGALLAGGPDQESERVRKALLDYRSWQKVNAAPMDMSESMKYLCRGPLGWDRDPKNPHYPRQFNVWVNRVGVAAMRSKGVPAFPVGSMIVKEKFPRTAASLKTASPELLTAMVKRERGFDSKNGDWQYFVLKGDASKGTEKGLAYCADCHRQNAKNGYVFRNYLTASPPKL